MHAQASDRDCNSADIVTDVCAACTLVHPQQDMPGSRSCSGDAYRLVEVLQAVHHQVYAMRQDLSRLLVVAVGGVNGSLGFASDTLHVLLVLFLDILDTDVVHAVKQRNLQSSHVIFNASG